MDVELAAAMPHGVLEEVFKDVFFVTGTTCPHFLERDWQFSRNMVVVREGGDLTLINTVRLDEDGLAALEALGTPRHVVRLGAWHGMDDAFYLRRYNAALWALPGMEHAHGHATDHALTVGGPTPFSGVSLFQFETITTQEGLLLIERDGGILVSCDSLQNWSGPDAYFDASSAQSMGAMGFFRSGNIGPGFIAGAQPQPEDFIRLKALEYAHLLSAHGEVLRDNAKAVVEQTIAELIGV